MGMNGVQGVGGSNPIAPTKSRLAAFTRNKSAELVETFIEIKNGMREKNNEVLINRFAEFKIWITRLKRFFKKLLHVK